MLRQLGIEQHLGKLEYTGAFWASRAPRSAGSLRGAVFYLVGTVSLLNTLAFRPLARASLGMSATPGLKPLGPRGDRLPNFGTLRNRSA
jgi:hypothetical protein